MEILTKLQENSKRTMMKYLQGSIDIYSVQIYTMLHINTSTPTKEQEQRV